MSSRPHRERRLGWISRYATAGNCSLSYAADRQETLEEHYYKFVTQGLHYRSVLSTSTLIRVLDVLINAGSFDPNAQYVSFELELHLRCLVAALRVLAAYGSFNCSGYLTFDLLGRLYSSLAKWAQFLVPRGQSLYQTIYAGSVKNYNNEFLIVHARDLIASVSSDRDLMVQTVTNISAGLHIPSVISLLSPLTQINATLPTMPTMLQPSLKRRVTPSAWYDDYRAVQNMLLNLRLFLEFNARENTKGLVREAVESLETFWNDSKTYFDMVVSELVKNDVNKSNAIKGLENGTFPALEAEATQNDEAIDSPPIARTGHFAFALLDLIQQSIRPGSPRRFDDSIRLAMYVVKNAAHSFLRRKALEVLLSIGKVEGVGLVSIEKELAQATENRKLVEDWKEVKRQAERRATFRAQLASIVCDSKNILQVNVP